MMRRLVRRAVFLTEVAVVLSLLTATGAMTALQGCLQSLPVAP